MYGVWIHVCILKKLFISNFGSWYIQTSIETFFYWMHAMSKMFLWQKNCLLCSLFPYKIVFMCFKCCIFRIYYFHHSPLPFTICSCCKTFFCWKCDPIKRSFYKLVSSCVIWLHDLLRFIETQQLDNELQQDALNVTICFTAGIERLLLQTFHFWNTAQYWFTSFLSAFYSFTWW